MNIGLDIGYSAVKVISGERRVTFSSAVGTPDKARFSLDGSKSIFLVHPDHVQVGEGAIAQSRFLRQREDRRWVESDEWYNLFLAAIAELTTASKVVLRIVTGLPVVFYDDRMAVQDRLLGNHRVQREERHAQVLQVGEAKVIPQPFGALLAMTLDNRGRIVDRNLATGTVAVIDVGGKTTNLLSVNHLSEIRGETSSVSVGAWDVVRMIRDWLSTHYPGLEELRGHQIMDTIVARETRYYGEPVNLATIVEETLEPLADQVLAEATGLWGNGATLDAALVSGGGALLLGPYVQQYFRHARVIPEPIFANALGFWRFAERLAPPVTKFV
ncbi:MAG: ParM/StbA family protein [Chloroflexota bacterium]|nr:ParM/StbA family protein [Chloroflexota bacterium]